MLKASITVEYKHRVHCPHCHAPAGSVSHLFSEKLPRSFGPWYCDSCYGEYRGTINAPNDIDLVMGKPKARVETLVLLELPPQEKTVYIILEDKCFVPDTDQSADDFASRQAYFFNSHQCPESNLRKADMVIYDGETDPHGIFSYVKTIPASVKEDYTNHGPNSSSFDEEGFLRDHFPEVVGEPTTIDGTVKDADALEITFESN